MNPRLRPAKRRSHETIAIEHEGQRFKIGSVASWCAPSASALARWSRSF
jgi:hypothetical protein